MAKFCLKCFNITTSGNLTQRDVILSKSLDLCEVCGKYRNVVLSYRKTKILYDLKTKIKHAKKGGHGNPPLRCWRSLGIGGFRCWWV